MLFLNASFSVVKFKTTVIHKRVKFVEVYNTSDVTGVEFFIFFRWYKKHLIFRFSNQLCEINLTVLPNIFYGKNSCSRFWIYINLILRLYRWLQISLVICIYSVFLYQWLSKWQEKFNCGNCSPLIVLESTQTKVSYIN